MIETLAGVGLPGLRAANKRTADPDLAMRQATSLGHQVNGAERLTGYLADLLQVPVRLREFVGHRPWAHLDIAGPAYNDSSPWGLTPTGGTGMGVSTLVELLRSLSAEVSILS